MWDVGNDMFVTASLGDQYPKNIRVCFIDPNNITNSLDKDILTDEGINGNVSGKACGRLGGISKLGNKYGLIYARNPCTVKDYNGKVETTTTKNWYCYFYLRWKNF